VARRQGRYRRHRQGRQGPAASQREGDAALGPERGHGGPDLTTDQERPLVDASVLVWGPWGRGLRGRGLHAEEDPDPAPGGLANDTVDVQLEPQKCPGARGRQPPAERRSWSTAKKISKETAAAIEAGNAAMNEKNWSAARESYSKALVDPRTTRPAPPAHGVRLPGRGNKDEAVKYAGRRRRSRPGESAPWQLHRGGGDRARQRGGRAAGRLSSKVPPEKIVDSGLYTNAGVSLYNKKKLAEGRGRVRQGHRAIKPDATSTTTEA
jgi:hypothetical protein